MRKRRNILIFDDLPPSKFEVRKGAQALGCTIKQTQSQRFNNKKRRLEVHLTIKQHPEWKVLLALSYYSNALLQSIKLDAIISKILLMKYQQKVSLTIEDLSKKIWQYRNLVKYEFVESPPVETDQEMLDLIKERLEIFEQCKEITVDKKTGTISLN